MHASFGLVGSNVVGQEIERVSWPEGGHRQQGIISLLNTSSPNGLSDTKGNISGF